MADEITRLVTRLELQNNDAHDRGLDVSIGKINQFAQAGNGAFGNVGNAAAAIAPKMDSAAQSITNVERAAQRIGPASAGFSTAGNAVSALSAKIDQNKATMSGYSASILDSREKMVSLSREIDSAKTKFGSNSDEVKKLQADYKTLSLDTRALGVDKQRLAQQTQGLQSSLKSEEAALKAEEAALKSSRAEAEKASISWEKMRSGAKTFGDTATTVGRGLSATLTLPILGIGLAAAKMSTDFNEAMANVATLLPRGSAQAAGFKKEIQDMAIAMGKSTKDLAHGFYEVISSIGPVDDALKILEINAKAGAAGLSTTQEALKFTAAVTKTYGDISAEAFQKVSDLGFQAVNLGQTTFPELAASIGGVAPIAKEVGISMEEMFAVLATATGVTGNTSEVVTQMASAISGLITPGKELKAIYAGLGVASGEALIKQHGLVGSLQLVSDAAKKAGIPLIELVGRKEAWILASSLAGSQADVFSEKMKAMGNVVGATDKAFSEQTQGLNKLGFTWEQLKVKVEVTLQRLGDDLAPVLAETADAMQPLIQHVTDAAKWFGSLSPEAKRTAVEILAVAAATGPLLIAVGKLSSGVSGTIKILSSMSTTLGKFGISGGPVAIAIAGAVALGAAYVTNFGNMRDAVNAFFRDYSKGADEANKATGRFGSEGESYLKRFGVAAVEIFDTVITWVKKLSVSISTIGKIFDMAWDFDTDWDDVTKAWREGTEEIDRIEKDFASRSNERHVILTDQWHKQAQRSFEIHKEMEQNGAASIQAFYDGQVSALAVKNPAAAIQQALVAGGGPTIEAARLLGTRSGFAAADSFTSTFYKETHKSPFYTAHELMNGLAETVIVAEGFSKVGFTAGESLKKGAKGKGKAMAKAMLDEFQDGSAGLESAIEALTSRADKGGFDFLFKKIGQGARESADKVKNELKSAVDAINEYIKAAGGSGKITPVQLAKNFFDYKPILDESLAFDKLKESIDKINLDRFKNHLTALDDKLDLNGNTIEINIKTLQALRDAHDEVIPVLDKVGLKLKGITQAHSVFSDVVAEESKIVSAANTDMARQSAASFQAYIDSLNRAAEEAPKPWEASSIRIIQAVDKIKEKIAGIEELNVLNARLDISSSLISQLDHLADVSGQDRDKILAQFRDMAAGMGSSSTEMQQQIALIDQAILNSQLSKLEDVWGKPMGRAIEVILSHYKKLDVSTANLKTSMLSKVTAVGELFAVLPGKVGQSVSKVINTINTVIDIATKALNVLEAFGVKLPKPIQDALDILNKGAGSTTAVMKEMSAEVQNILKNMSIQIVGIFNKLSGEIKSKIDGMKQSAGTGAQGITSNFMGGVSPLPGLLGGVLNQTSGMFGGWGSKITSIIQTVLGSITGYGNQTSVVFSASIAPVQFYANTFTSSMNQVAFSATSTAQQVTAATGQMNAAAASGAQGLGKLVAGIGGVLAGASMIANVFGSGMGRVKGGIQGALGGATAGASLGFMFGGPVGAGIGALIGAGAGAILGIFGGGKTELQKAQAAAQLQAAKDQIKLSQEQVKQAMEATKQAVIQTGSQLADYINKMADSTLVPKSVITKFINRGVELLSQLADGLKGIASKFTPEMKAAAESAQSVVGLAAITPDAFDAIGRSIPLAQASVNTWSRNINLLWDGFGVAVEDVSKKERKHAEKFANSFSAVVNIITPSIEGMNNFFRVKRVDESSVATWVGNITIIEKGMAQAADDLDGYGTKQAERLANSGSAILTFISNYADTQSKIIGISLPSASDYANLFEGAKVAFGQSIAFAKSLETEGLQLSAEVSKLGSEIFGALNTEIDFIEKAVALKDVDFNVIPGTIHALLDATQLAVQLSAQAAKTIGQEMTDEAAKFALGAKDVVSLYGETAKSFGDASITRDIYPATIINLSNGIEMAVREVAGLKQRTGELLKESEGAAASINATLSVVSNAGSAFRDLGIGEDGKAPVFSIQVIDNLMNITEYSIGRVVTLSKSISASDRAAAVSFSGDTHLIATNMSDGLGFLKAIADQPALSISSFDVMVNNVANMHSALGSALNEMLGARDDSRLFLSASEEAKLNISAGISNLATALSNATAGASGNFAPSSFTQAVTVNNVPSSPIVPVAPVVVAPAAPAQGSSQTIIHQPLHFNGNVYLGEELAPAELRERVKRTMDEWYQEKVSEELHRLRQG